MLTLCKICNSMMSEGGKTMIGERLKSIREKTGMNKKDFATYLGLKYTTYNNYETEAREPASDFLILISEKFDVSIDYIFGLKKEGIVEHSYQLKSSEFNIIEKYRKLSPHGKEVVDFILEKEYEHSLECIIPDSTTRFVPYFYRLASAGTGQIIFDTPPTKSIEIPSAYTNVDYALGVNGDSMSPDYEDGDTLLVEMTNSIEKGDIGIFQVDNMCYVKKLGNGELISINKNYENIKLNETSSCLGRVVDKL